MELRVQWLQLVTVLRETRPAGEANVGRHCSGLGKET